MARSKASGARRRRVCLLALAVLGTACERRLERAPDILAPAERASVAPEVAAAADAAAARVAAGPRSFPAHLALAMLLDANGLPSPAAREYESALALEPASPRVLYHLALCRDLLGQAEAAVALMERTVASDPPYAPALGRLGQWHLEAGRLESAEAAFARARDVAPEHPVGAEGLARVALARGDPERAIAVLTTHLTQHEGRGYAHFLLGTALRDAGRADEAASHLETGHEASPAWPDPWRAEVMEHLVGAQAVLDHAVELGQRGTAEGALPALRALHESDPSDIVALEKLVGALMQAGHLDEAAEVVGRATAEGGHPRAWFLTALVHEESGALAPALAAADRALRAQPSWAPAHALLARLRWKAGDLAGAAEALEGTLRLSGEDPATLLKLARARALLGQWGPSAEAARRATVAEPGNAQAWAARAEAAAAMGERDACHAALTEALRLDPADGQVRRVAAALEDS